ncbi:MAG TPA: hypothetical protein VFY87_19790 [Geminicoccaceae bacterium]|nr:hypothetical protein [Geminicoccaceae bacterium]
MSAVRLLREAQAAGLRLRVEDGQVRVAADRAPPTELLEGLRAHKSEILELLRGERCRGCGERLAWPAPVGVVHGDGQASCLPCYYEAAAKRAVLSPDVLADPAELTARGEPLP